MHQQNAKVATKQKRLTHQPATTLGPLRKITSHLRQIDMIILGIQQRQYELRYRMALETGVHRTHEDAIGQGANVGT